VKRGNGRGMISQKVGSTPDRGGAPLRGKGGAMKNCRAVAGSVIEEQVRREQARLSDAAVVVAGVDFQA